MLEGGGRTSDTPFHVTTISGMEGHAAALPFFRNMVLSDLVICCLDLKMPSLPVHLC